MAADKTLEKERLESLDFEELLQKFDYSFKKGDLIKGTVVSIEKGNSALVDIGAKTIAFVPPREVATDPKKAAEELEPGKEYEFLIIREEDEDGQFTLSRKKVAQAYSWKELEKVKETDETIEGVVNSSVKGGVLVEVMGVRGFVPLSHLRVRDMESIIGETLKLKVLSMDSSSNNLILSHRKVFADVQAEKRKDVFETLEVGNVVEGEVVRLADFGAFIDIGGIDGLLPLSQMSWRWVDHPADILTVGETVKVEVIGIDHDKQRVSLSLKNLQADPWDEAKDKIVEGEKITGKVTRIKHFGAFVEVFPGVEALLPHKEVLEYQNQTDKILGVGDNIETTVMRFNPEDRRISLSVSGEAPMEEKEKEKE